VAAIGLIAAAGLSAGLAAGPVGTVAAAAAGGTWGAGHYRYADGRVCAEGGRTSPLAAWTVDGGHRAYLTQAVTSDGHTDSAVPPIPGAGTAQPAAPVTAGGQFAADADVAAVAYLLAGGGDAAQLAADVLAQTDPSALPSCADPNASFSALSRARQLAGPYQVAVTAPSGKLQPGAAGPVSATVHAQSGAPVPNARVTFSSPDATPESVSAVTDATGTAQAQLRIRAGAPAAVNLTATTSVVTGLLEATVIATPSVTNPTGASVSAVYPAPPSPYSAQASVAVDQTAHPVVSSALGSRLAAVDNGFVPRARVRGLNGHAADVTFDLLGPRPLKDGRQCAGIDASAWKGMNVATTSNTTVTGDGPVTGGSLTPGAAGCYALRTTVATVDATPAAVKVAPLVVVTVVDTTLSRADDQPAVTTPRTAGPITGQLNVGNLHGLHGTVQVSFTGPIDPADGDCGPDAPGWSKAPHHSSAATVQAVDGRSAKVTADGRYEYSVPAPSAVGCYHAQPALVLTDADGQRLTLATSDSRDAYVLDPSISAAVRQTWSVTPDPVPVSVEVSGLFGLAAHVHVAMYSAAANEGGCAQASFSSATHAGDGPDVDLPARPGIVSVLAESGPTTKQGCYAVVPELVLTANPRVRVSAPVGGPDTTLIAGIDPDTRIRPTAQHGDPGTPLGFVIAGCVLAGLLALAIVRVGFVAWRDRDESAGWTAPRDVDRLGLTDDELPSAI